jgi:hypothetical protein
MAAATAATAAPALLPHAGAFRSSISNLSDELGSIPHCMATAQPSPPWGAAPTSQPGRPISQPREAPGYILPRHSSGRGRGGAGWCPLTAGKPASPYALAALVVMIAFSPCFMVITPRSLQPTGPPCTTEQTQGIHGTPRTPPANWPGSAPCRDDLAHTNLCSSHAQHHSQANASRHA